MNTIAFNIGGTVDEAAQNAREFAAGVYLAIPTGDPCGQTFKNEFTRAFLEQSSRARTVAGEVLGVGTAKGVNDSGDFDDEDEDDYAEENSDWDDDDDDYNCCEFCG